MSDLSNRAGSSRDSTVAYAAKLRSMAGEDAIAALRAFPEQLRAAVAHLDREVVTRPEAENRWSILQVIEHLADHEMIVGVRIRMILAHDEPEIQPFDQDLWATRLHCSERSVDESVDDFTCMRRRNARLLSSLSESEFARVGIHRERGPESVRHFVELTAGHDIAHLEQICRILRAQVADSG